MNPKVFYLPFIILLVAAAIVQTSDANTEPQSSLQKLVAAEGISTCMSYLMEDPSDRLSEWSRVILESLGRTGDPTNDRHYECATDPKTIIKLDEMVVQLCGELEAVGFNYHHIAIEAQRRVLMPCRILIMPMVCEDNQIPRCVDKR